MLASNIFNLLGITRIVASITPLSVPASLLEFDIWLLLGVTVLLLPLMLTGSRLSEENVVQAFAAGATDFLVKPIKPTLLRSRVGGWLLRQRRFDGGLGC